MYGTLSSFQTLFDTKIGEGLKEACPRGAHIIWTWRVLQPRREFLTECTEKYDIFSVCVVYKPVNASQCQIFSEQTANCSPCESVSPFSSSKWVCWHVPSKPQCETLSVSEPDSSLRPRGRSASNLTPRPRFLTFSLRSARARLIVTGSVQTLFC